MHRSLCLGLSIASILLVLQCAGVAMATSFRPAPCAVERRSLAEIYAAALAEGGQMILYAGGDIPGQWDSIKEEFKAAFPNITLSIVTDYSKWHSPRVDYQLNVSHLVPDAVQFQTLQDFPRWKAQGVLQPYKAANWSAIYRDFRDEDGFYTGFSVALLSGLVNSQLLNESQWPRTAKDYLKPAHKANMWVTYPNDDDAMLFWFNQTIDKYGWEWFHAFLAQQPIFVRGSPAPIAAVMNGSCPATMSFVFNSSPANFSAPADNDPFTTWAQYFALLKGARHPEAAKLYLNWILTKESSTQAGGLFSVRTDMAPTAGYRHIWEYPNSSHRKFEAFMGQRALVERFRAEITVHIGEPQGEPSTKGELLGLFPTEALAH